MSLGALNEAGSGNALPLWLLEDVETACPQGVGTQRVETIGSCPSVFHASLTCEHPDVSDVVPTGSSHLPYRLVL